MAASVAVRRILALMALAGIATAPLAVPRAPQKQSAATGSSGPHWKTFFEPNIGQAPSSVRFRGVGGQTAVEVEANGIRLLSPARDGGVGIQFEGANPDARVRGAEPLPSFSNYYAGASEYLRIPHYVSVQFAGLYQGIDLLIYDHEKRLEYDLVVKPHADPSRIRFSVKGGKARLTASGALVVEAGGSSLEWERPVAYQRIDGVRREVRASYVANEETVSFELGDYDPSHELTIDPVLNYTTRLFSADVGSVAADSNEQLYVCGLAYFPLSTAVVFTVPMIAALTPSGDALRYITYFGPKEPPPLMAPFDLDWPRAAVVRGNSLYVAGYSGARSAFQNRGGFQARYGGGAYDAFVARFNIVTGGIEAGTLLGGSGDFDQAFALALDANGFVYVTGRTSSPNFPTRGANQMPPLQATYAGNQFDHDAFVAKLHPQLTTLIYSTYFGGGQNDVGRAIVVNAQGEAIVAGLTTSANFPTMLPIQARYAGGISDAFLSRLDANGSRLLSSTFFGGQTRDLAMGIAMDAAGATYVVGITDSSNFPLAGARLTAGAALDGFLTKFSPSEAQVEFSVKFGGTGRDLPGAVALDGNGNVYISGDTESTDFPLAGAVQTAASALGDAFLMHLKTPGPVLSFSTYVGGDGQEFDRFAVNQTDGPNPSKVLVTRSAGYLYGDSLSSNLPMSRPITLPDGVRVFSRGAFVSKFTDFGGACAYDIDRSAVPAVVSAAGASVNLPIKATPSICAWAVTSEVSWIRVVAGATGTNTGTITIQVSENTTGNERSGAIVVGTQRILVRQAVPEPPAALTIVSGNGQRGVSGQALPLPLVVAVTSASGAPVAGVAVRFSVVLGAATLTPATATTDGNGRAQTRVQFGSTSRAAVAASVTGLEPVLFDLTAARDPRLPPFYTISTFAGQWRLEDSSAADALFFNAAQMALLPDGQLLVADAGNNLMRSITTEGVVRVFAGGGNSVVVPDGSPATTIRLTNPQGLAVDRNGRVYLSESHRIHRVDGDGTIRLIGGTGRQGFAGDGGPATAASLNFPTALAVGPNDELYIADRSNHRIRRLDANGVISTFAGTGRSGSTGDGGPATAADLSFPQGLAVDGDGNVYIAESSKIRRVGTDGAITTVAGRDAAGFGGDGGLATAATLTLPRSVSVDASGTLLIAESSRIRRVQNGRIATIAGSGLGNPILVDTIAPLQADLRLISGVLAAPDGTLFLAERNSIWRLGAGEDLRRVAGRTPLATEEVPKEEAIFDSPARMVRDGAGNWYVADGANNRIWRIDAAGRVSAFAGTGRQGFRGDGVAAANAELRTPTDVAVDGEGNVYIADSANRRVRRVGADGIIRTIAGTGTATTGGDGGPALSASFEPFRLALDAAGNLYLSDRLASRIRKIGRDGTITTVAGTGSRGFSGDGGPAVDAELNTPEALTIAPDGSLYFTDNFGSRIRRIDGEGEIRTVAGSGVLGFRGENSPASDAYLRAADLLMDGQGNLFLADGPNNRIRVVTPLGLIHTIAGTGVAGFSGDGTIGLEAEVNNPTGIALTADGDLMIADQGNHRLRVLRAVP